MEEALLTAKGKVMLNLDKAFDYFDQVYELLEKTGTTNLVIMKSNAPAEDVKRDYGKYLDKVSSCQRLIWMTKMPFRS